jgi:NTE family protein
MFKQRLHRSLRAGLALVALGVIGCVGFTPANTPLERFDPGRGYRYTTARPPNLSGEIALYLAFSGGGTRAAALAYGVLEELRDTSVVVAGRSIRLLDEIDTISGVSGGSFPAAYYGLFGDRIFEDFEAGFLRTNVQLEILLRALRPWNLIRLLTPWLSRSDLAASVYDRRLFGGATFADLTRAKGPLIHINATDLSSGERFTFNQETFDIICSDLDVLKISTAVAASSAVPMLLSPITLKNHTGTCGYESPEWVKEAMARRLSDPRLDRAARRYSQLQDAERKQYLHLLDGGISDNLGLRPIIDMVIAAGGIQEASRIQGRAVPNHIALIVVNAETDPDPTIDVSAAAPSFASLMQSVSAGQIRRMNFETIMLLQELMKNWGREFETNGRRVRIHVIQVGFDELDDPTERSILKHIATTFSLGDDEIDQLRRAGREILRNSGDYRQFVDALR